MLVVFDLDETLLLTRRLRTDSFYPETEDFRMNLGETCFRVWVRPGARELIAYCQEHFQVAVWSSAKADYVYELAAHLFETEKLKFVWHRDHCDFTETNEEGETSPVKDLRMLSFPVSQTLIIDDDANTACRNLRNLIQVPMFSDSPTEAALLAVLEELKRRAELKDVRQERRVSVNQS